MESLTDKIDDLDDDLDEIDEIIFNSILTRSYMKSIGFDDDLYEALLESIHR